MDARQNAEGGNHRVGKTLSRFGLGAESSHPVTKLFLIFPGDGIWRIREFHLTEIDYTVRPADKLAASYKKIEMWSIIRF